MNELEKSYILDEISLSQLGEFILDYVYYWSAKTGIDELSLLKKLFNYVDLTVSKRIVDDQLFLLHYKLRNMKENDWLEE